MPEHDGIHWRKSSYSAAQNGCVEVATTRPEVRLRDTKDRAAGSFGVPAPSWRAFLSRVR